ncbi:hypothetical protein C9374_000704 [Naegleria lovaniensis]|uniref:Uncharacterized protein n=1 Tax=Naegleria lovaniensis TaxID=51637 RepID=A0AA88KM42_NAELO|nr:uncharacterized protein C9374_000704 [Naegleria lovaniensis]KAG2388540.1 hypothetical protein C9374_000704 [Naegleria lovaniensis]
MKFLSEESLLDAYSSVHQNPCSATLANLTQFTTPSSLVSMITGEFSSSSSENPKHNSPSSRYDHIFRPSLTSTTTTTIDPTNNHPLMIEPQYGLSTTTLHQKESLKKDLSVRNDDDESFLLGSSSCSLKSNNNDQPFSGSNSTLLTRNDKDAEQYTNKENFKHSNTSKMNTTTNKLLVSPKDNVLRRNAPRTPHKSLSSLSSPLLSTTPKSSKAFIQSPQSHDSFSSPQPERSPLLDSNQKRRRPRQSSLSSPMAKLDLKTPPSSIRNQSSLKTCSLTLACSSPCMSSESSKKRKNIPTASTSSGFNFNDIFTPPAVKKKKIPDEQLVNVLVGEEEQVEDHLETSMFMLDLFKTPPPVTTRNKSKATELFEESDGILKCVVSNLTSGTLESCENAPSIFEKEDGEVVTTFLSTRNKMKSSIPVEEVDSTDGESCR